MEVILLVIIMVEMDMELKLQDYNLEEQQVEEQLIMLQKNIMELVGQLVVIYQVLDHPLLLQELKLRECLMEVL